MTLARTLIDQFQSDYQLGDARMDDTHMAFLQLAEQAATAPAAEFASAFNTLFEHTQAHFADEEQRMAESGHGLLAEHRADHQRILGDMARFNERAAAGRAAMAKAWVGDSLLQWFSTHAKTMDSALAAEMKEAG